jgi:hypothetical protein
MRDSSMFYFNIAINHCAGWKYSPYPWLALGAFGEHPRRWHRILYCTGCKYSPHPELVREQSGNNSACGQRIDLLVFTRASQGGRGSVVE